MMGARHTLKTHSPVWEAVSRGDKTFEVRKDDRAFQAGDIVDLVRYDPGESLKPSELDQRLVHSLTYRIGFVLRGGQYGIEPGYVAFSLLPLRQDER